MTDVFSDPQIASVGLAAQEARRLGIDYTAALKPYADTAYGWALEDTSSFVKLVADPRAGRLLGAHIIGPQAALLLQPLLQAMMLGQTVEQLAHQVLYVHPALSEASNRRFWNCDPTHADRRNLPPVSLQTGYVHRHDLRRVQIRGTNGGQGVAGRPVAAISGAIRSTFWCDRKFTARAVTS